MKFHFNRIVCNNNNNNININNNINDNINDIVNVSALVDFLIFADDTNLFISSHSLESLSVIANTVLAKLAKWFRLNKLSLNVNKTNYI